MSRSHGIFSFPVSFMKPKEWALSPALPSLPMSPKLAVQEIGSPIKYFSREEKYSLGSTVCEGGGWCLFFFFHKRPSGEAP